MVQQLAVKIAKDSEKRNRQGFSMCSDSVLGDFLEFGDGNLNASYVLFFFSGL